MSDVGPAMPQPVQPEVPLADAFKALSDGVGKPTPVSTPLLTSPIPYPAPPPGASPVKDWHKDPLKQGLADGFYTNYANQVGPQAAFQHIATMQQAMDQGLVPSTGDDQDTHQLWNKFRQAPEQMKPDESASLMEKLGRIGSATQAIPGLRFDPIGKVAAVSGDGSVRVSYPNRPSPAALDLRPLAGSGLDNLRRLSGIGLGATKGATLDDVFPAFLGVRPGERPTKQQLSDLNDAVNLIAQESGSDPAGVLAAVAAGWATVAPKQKPWERPWALALNGPNPVQAALTDSLQPNLIAAMKAGVGSLDFTGGKNLSVTTDPAGTLAVSGDNTSQHNRLLRHLYPAFSQGGTTAWLPGRPAPVQDATSLRGQVALFNGPLLDKLGGHPGLVPGDHIIFEQPGRLNAKVQSVPLGPVLSTEPEFSLERLGQADIDPTQFTSAQSPLFTHAWALVPGGNDVKVKASQQGFKPISHTLGDVQHQLIFGIAPSQAQKLANGTIYTNKGTWSADGFRPGNISFDNSPVKSTTRLLTGNVDWHLAHDTGDDPAPDVSPEIDNIQRKPKLNLMQDVPDLEQALSQLKQAGVKGLRIYTHRTDVPGFKPVTEHIFSDGLNYASHLSPGVDSAAHAVPVFVPENWHIPPAAEQVPTVRHGTTGTQINGVSILTQSKPNSLSDLKEKFLASDGDALISTDTPTDVRLSGGRLVVDQPTPDSANTTRLGRLAGGAADGFQPGKADVSDRTSAITITGRKVPALRRTRPLDAWANEHGIEFDPTWRQSQGLVSLDPGVINQLSAVYSAFKSQHPEAANLWGLSKIGMTSGYSASPTYTEWGKLGGAIGLSTAHWGDTDKLAQQTVDYAKHGVTAGSGLGYLLAHELGHVVGGALQFGSDGSGVARALADIRSTAGKTGIQQSLSKIAWQSPEETVAESVAQGLMGKPGAVARVVLSAIGDGYRKVLAART